jgi:hypothetical protein
MRKWGIGGLLLGSVVIMLSFGYDTAPEGTHNIGLLQDQMMFFQFGTLLCLLGMLLFALGELLGRLEGSGIISARNRELEDGSASSAEQTQQPGL